MTIVNLKLFCTTDDPPAEEVSSGRPKTAHTYSHVAASDVATNATVHSHEFQPKQLVMPAIQKRQQTHINSDIPSTAVSTQDQGTVVGLQTQLNTHLLEAPGEAKQQELRFNAANQYINEDSVLVKPLIKDPLPTKDLTNRLQGIALKQRTTAAVRTGSSSTMDRNTIQGKL